MHRIKHDLAISLRVQPLVYASHAMGFDVCRQTVRERDRPQANYRVGTIIVSRDGNLSGA